MSGQLVGEVNRAGRRLRTAGVPRLAARALSVVAECCRDNRLGPVPLEYLAGAMEGGSERSASRALSKLRDLGLIAVVRRGGGRGHSGRPAVYRLVDVDRWCTDHGAPPAVASQSATDAELDVDHHEFSRHDGGDSIGPSGVSIADGDPFTADSPATTGGSISAFGDSMGYSPAKSGLLSRHLGGVLPVPVRTPGGASPDPAARPAELDADHPAPRPRTRPRPQAPGQLPLVAPVRDQPDLDAAAGSWCGRADCRAPAPCGACGRAKEQHTTQARYAAHDVAEAAVRARRDRARQRAVAAAACPLCDDDGYVGTQVCDHQAHRPIQTIAGWQMARHVADSSAARGAARRLERPPARRRPAARTRAAS